jgi:hypothetical protein
VFLTSFIFGVDCWEERFDFAETKLKIVDWFCGLSGIHNMFIFLVSGLKIELFYYTREGIQSNIFYTTELEWILSK